ncbi:MAG: hypothetical protein GY737_18995 [Desulfobacteraceae bacterium]|nr:hypothetical protein [Desulfobacteraceae bacterium]
MMGQMHLGTENTNFLLTNTSSMIFGQSGTESVFIKTLGVMTLGGAAISSTASAVTPNSIDRSITAGGDAHLFPNCCLL